MEEKGVAVVSPSVLTDILSRCQKTVSAEKSTEHISFKI